MIHTSNQVAFGGHLKTYEMRKDTSGYCNIGAYEVSKNLETALKELEGSSSSDKMISNNTLYTVKVGETRDLHRQDTLTLTAFNTETGDLCQVQATESDVNEAEASLTKKNQFVTYYDDLKQSLTQIKQAFPKVEMPEWLNQFVSSEK